MSIPPRSSQTGWSRLWTEADDRRTSEQLPLKLELRTIPQARTLGTLTVIRGSRARIAAALADPN